MFNWGADIEPFPLRRQCASCGIAAFALDRLNLCEQCREDYDNWMAELDGDDRGSDDAAARHAYYGP